MDKKDPDAHIIGISLAVFAMICVILLRASGPPVEIGTPGHPMTLLDWKLMQQIIHY